MQYTSPEVYEYISHQTDDPIVEWKTCRISGTKFAIYQSDLDFYTKISPTFAGQKFQIPTPTLCPEERQRRRLSFRNERKLYRRQCDASKKSIISIYSPDKPYKVYDQKIWRSDAWDPMDYGIDFDFSKTFTEQFGELMKVVPRIALMNDNDITSENCIYTQDFSFGKNCYMMFGAWKDENCMYCCRNITNSNNIYDCLGPITNCNNSYGCSSSRQLQNCFYVSDSENCFECYHSNYLIGCKYCINCSNLNNKEYYINNQFVGKEVFCSIDKHMKNVNHLIYPTLYNTESNNLLGCNNMINSSSCLLSSDSLKLQDCKYYYSGDGGKTCMDVWIAGECELCLDMLTCDNCFSTSFSTFVWQSRNSLYSDISLGCDNLFGCIGLRNKSYCIFNKQYNKEDYETTVAKIITHMQQTGERGEFFHPSLSPFGYNETVAQEYFPIGGEGEKNRESENIHTLGKHGYHWSDYSNDPAIPEGVPTIKKSDYTDEQRSALLQSDNLETKVFICSVSSRPYRLQKAEIEFYRKHNLPIPDKHPDVRHEERMKLRPGRALYLRNCDCCSQEMLSVYDQNYDGKVYCERCYQKEIYG